MCNLEDIEASWRGETERRDDFIWRSGRDTFVGGNKRDRGEGRERQ